MADSILTPLNPVDTEKLAKVAKELYDAQPKHDHRTVEDLRIELRGLEDRKQSHDELIDRAEGDLKELNQRFAKLTNALATAKDMVGVRPALRRDIPPLERALAALVEDIADKEQYIRRHKNIAQGVALLIKGFDHKLLKKLEQQEKVLQQAGL
jgi:hypothetical protein